jgi:hypothetical protein
MRYWFALIILFLSFPGQSREVYKWTSEDGVIQYSDTYISGAERVTLSEGKGRVKPQESSQLEEKNQPPGDANGYELFEITQPENDETIRSNEGVVTVGLSLSPALQPEHTIHIYIDGAKLDSDLRMTQFTLKDLNRGTHTLEARVVDASGNQQISTKPINFHLRKATILQP